MVCNDPSGGWSARRFAIGRMHGPAFAGLASLLMMAASCSSSKDSTELGVVITDSNIWHTHPPGGLFQVGVQVVGSASLAATVTCQWVDQHRQPIGGAIAVSGTPTTIQSPSIAAGFYGLVFTSTLAPHLPFIVILTVLFMTKVIGR